MSLRAWDVVRLALAIAGVAVMGYLTFVHYQGEDLLACPGGGTVNCEKALASPQSELFGVPISIFGILWFVLAGAVALWSLLSAPLWVARASLVWTGAATVVVLYLVYAELAIIRAVCLWCTVAHAVILALLVIEVLTYPARSAGAPAPRVPPGPEE